VKKFFLILVLLCLPVQAQFNEWGSKFGLRGSLLFPENEYANLGFSGNDDFSFDWYKTSLLGEAFAGFELSKLFELQVTGGYGYYTGRAVFQKDSYFGDYKSTIIPLTLRLRVTPFSFSFWNPYFYAGGGMMKYKLETIPNVVSPTAVKTSGWSANLPAGIGAEFMITDGVLLDLSIGGAFGSNRDLDAYSSNHNLTWDSYLNTSLGLSVTWESCMTDKDADGLGKCDEEKAGTDPRNSDSDYDGLSDGEEYLIYKTNPLLADTDGDGLVDGMEVQNTKTNPLLADTDGDGLSDGEEFKKYRTNPLLTDSDNDGLDDYYEVNVSRSSPLSSDTDKDGISDADEVNKHKTDPLKEDTDGDGLTDYEEIFENLTNPLNKDTDGGKINDLVEVVRGTDPLNPDDDIIKMDTPIVLEGVTFASGSSRLSPESEQVLMKALKTMQTHPDIYVEISGHTDNVGSGASNKRLSEARAKSVRDWLIAKGVASERLRAAGYGDIIPRVPNDTNENKRLNRRIEFKRFK
jgi:outer membrane protein OmpA-like peptidoglycan-associated protein